MKGGSRKARGNRARKEPAAPAPSFDARWQQVTCCECKRAYTCTPEDDYYVPGGGRLADAESGACFRCLLAGGGTNPETTPVRVINLDEGGSSDPRDLALKDGGAAS